MFCLAERAVAELRRDPAAAGVRRRLPRLDAADPGAVQRLGNAAGDLRPGHRRAGAAARVRCQLAERHVQRRRADHRRRPVDPAFALRPLAASIKARFGRGSTGDDGDASGGSGVDVPPEPEPAPAATERRAAHATEPSRRDPFRIHQAHISEERSMTHIHDRAASPALIATLVLALAVAACGSDSSSSSSSASAGGSTSSSCGGAGVTKATDAAQAVRGGADRDHHQGAAQGRAARRQDPRHARDERPEQPEAAEVAEEARRDGEVELRRRQLRPRQPGDVQRRDRHGDHEEGQLHRRGRHPAHARDDQEGPGRRREVGADVRAPGRGQGPRSSSTPTPTPTTR